MDSRSIRRISKIAFFSLLLLLFACGKEADNAPLAPDFTLPDLSGQTRTLSDYRDRMVILDFWATWCPPCRMSIPELVELQKTYQDKGLVVLGISLDDPALKTEYLEAFKEKFKINYTILRFNMKVMGDYFPSQNPAVPTMFVIDREGRVRKKLVGFRPGALKESVEEYFK